MKALLLNNGYYNDAYYLFPEGIASLEQFADYVNKHFNEFVKMIELKTDSCCPPYFIEEDVRPVYLNFSRIEKMREYEVKGVLPKKEYEDRLKRIISEKCVHCISYKEDCDGDNLRGHWTEISLDGECNGFIPLKNKRKK